MKRDMDLARRILLEIEECPEANGSGWIDLEIEGHTQEDIVYHIMLLHEAGLIDAIDRSDTSGSDWGAVRLMWEGHEFLDKIRQDSVWQKAKRIVIEKTGGLSYGILSQLLTKAATDAVMGSG